MKVKAVIFRPDHTNDVVIPKRRNIEGKTFRHDNSTYFLHPDRAQITWTYRIIGRFWKRYFATYYYKMGVAQPLPVPDFKIVDEPEMVLVKVLGKDGKERLQYKPVLDAHGKPKISRSFPEMVDLGVSGEELAAIFNPWFYRVIANQGPDTLAKIQFYLIIGIAILSAFLTWKVMGLDAKFEEIKHLLQPEAA